MVERLLALEGVAGAGDVTPLIGRPHIDGLRDLIDEAYHELKPIEDAPFEITSWEPEKPDGERTAPPAAGSDLKREKIAKRDRRLVPDEERRLLAQAGPRLYRLIVAALETGCRLGELLLLRWEDVDLPGGELRVRAVNAKQRKLRAYPDRCQAARGAGHGTRRSRRPAVRFEGLYVFGDEVGRRLKSQQKAWETAVLKAHGLTPTCVRGGLAPASRDGYRTIDLHFLDLRHEAGSRWLEQGLPLHHVKELLGHASISTTDTYLNASRIHLRKSILEMEKRGKSDTNVPQNADTQPDQGVQERRMDAGKSLLH